MPLKNRHFHYDARKNVLRHLASLRHALRHGRLRSLPACVTAAPVFSDQPTSSSANPAPHFFLRTCREYCNTLTQKKMLA